MASEGRLPRAAPDGLFSSLPGRHSLKARSTGARRQRPAPYRKTAQMNDPVFDGLAEGFKPSADAIPVNTLALINISATLGRLEKLQERATQAAERQAAAMETFVALFASCIGVTRAYCPGEPNSTPVVNYIRASGNGKNFNCDQTEYVEDDE